MIFCSEQPFYGNYSTLDSHQYKHCNFSRVCLLVKMASKTVTRSISCLTCARTLTRVYANTKRLSSNSPTVIPPLSKRTCEDGATAKSRRCLDLADVSVLAEEVDKENSIPSAGHFFTGGCNGFKERFI